MMLGCLKSKVHCHDQRQIYFGLSAGPLVVTITAAVATNGSCAQGRSGVVCELGSLARGTGARRSRSW